MFQKLKELFGGRNEKLRVDNYWIFVSMLVGSILSLIASFILSVEAVELAYNPDAALACSINVVLNCATVALHPSANLLGFPNSFLGMMAMPVVITVAIAGLAGVKFPKLFMFAAQIGYTLGLFFAFWLLYMSYFVIGALCPWCLLVFFSTLVLWFAITRYNIREDNLYLPKKVSKTAKKFIEKDFDKLSLFLLAVVIVFSILIKYRDGLFS